MVLITHGVIGSAAAKILGTTNPLLGCAIGFASHFLADAIPHWHYQTSFFSPLKKRVTNPSTPFSLTGKALWTDLVSVGMDTTASLIIPIAIAFFFYPTHLLVTAASAVGAIAPDLLQVAYYLAPKTPLRFLQKFHIWIHAKTRLDDEPLWGMGTQAGIGIIALLVSIVMH